MVSPGVLYREYFQKDKCCWYSAPIRITGAYVYNIMDGRTAVHKGKRRHYLSHGFMIFRYAKTAALCGAKQISSADLQVETLG